MANGRETWTKMQQDFAKQRIEEDTKREIEYQERKRIQDVMNKQKKKQIVSAVIKD